MIMIHGLNLDGTAGINCQRPLRKSAGEMKK